MSIQNISNIFIYLSKFLNKKKKEMKILKKCQYTTHPDWQ
jgi:hypothetical protein